MRGNTARIADLYDRLAERNIRALILLGSPEQTHRVLARIADDNETRLGYPVFSFFSQDDMMGTEALSDLVLDFAALDERVDTQELPDEALQPLTAEVPELLYRVIRYAYNLPAPLPPDGNLSVHLSKMAGAEWKVLPYIDAETGMHPKNHFVIEKSAAK
jgi:hypothetical protein